MQDSFFMLSFVICFVRILGIKVLVTKKKKNSYYIKTKTEEHLVIYYNLLD